MSDPNQKREERKIFTKGETISFPGENGVDVCTITGLRGMCGTSVCYSAVRNSAAGRVSGTLTEFYPTDPIAGGDPPFYSMERLPDGRLVPCGGTVRRYPELVDVFQENFRKLCALSKKDKTKVFSHIAEKSELLRSSPVFSVSETDLTIRKQIPAVYIWMPDVSETLLTKYLHEYIRKEPDDSQRKLSADEKLQQVLSLLRQAAECIRTLHKAGFLHHSSQTDTFFVVQDESGNPALRMGVPYGLRTISSTMPCGIPENLSDAPELKEGIADIRTDVYAFGVLLFRSLVIHNKIKDGDYDDTFYDSLPQLIANSGLITRSSQHQNQALISVLSKLLKKALAADPAKRYSDFGKLLTDLRNALKLLQSAAEKTAVSAKNAGTMKSADAGLLMKMMLHKHPIYYALREKGAIHLAAVGTGKYTYAFLDNALQVCQMDGYSLYLTVFCDDPEEAESQYIGTRQDLPRFVDVITGDPDDAPLKEEQYGRICFTAWRKPEAAESKKQTRTGRLPDSRYIASILKEWQYQYGIVDVGSTAQNRKLAESMYEMMHSCDAHPVYVGYLNYDPPAAEETAEEDEPVFGIFCNWELTAQQVPQELSRMAFNSNILWNGNLNMDVQEEFREFLNTPYNYSSSLAYVVSIQYKLFGLGITAKTNADYAEAFRNSILADKDNAEKNRDYRRLVMYEHRRWVIEKVTDGWRAPRRADGSLDLETLVQNGMLKDEILQLHPCIVTSSEDAPLQAAEYAPGLGSRWNKEDAGLYEEEEQWDELDKMSVMMHRLFRKRAEEVRLSHPLNEGDVNKLQGLVAVANHDELRTAFQQYVFCLKNILNGAKSYSKKYNIYHKKMEHAAEQLKDKQRAEVLACLAGIKKQFFPVIESNLYRNRKANDNVMVDGIPFILTYQYHPMIVMPFQDARLHGGSNDALFQNVASASVLSPSHIHYLYCFTDYSRPGIVCEKLCGVMEYLQNRAVRTEVTFTIVKIGNVNDSAIQSAMDSVKNKYNNQSAAQNIHACFVGYQIRDAEDETAAMELFMQSINEKKPDLYDGSTPLFQSPALNSQFVNSIMMNKSLSYFEFDWRSKKFYGFDNQEASYLRYIQDNSYISADDMFALQQAKDKRFQFPEFMDDYEELWNIHTGGHLPEGKKQFQNGVECWNQFCTALANYDKKKSILASIERTEDKMDTELTFYLPAFAFRTTSNLLEQFKEMNLIDKKSHVDGYTSDTCCVHLIAAAKAAKGLGELFGQSAQYLQEYYAPYAMKLGNAVEVHYTNLEVVDIQFIQREGDHKKTLSLLNALAEAQYITLYSCEVKTVETPANLQDNQNETENHNAQDNSVRKKTTVSFRYTSPRIKKLLTNAGMILELHTFFSILKTGFFDEVITSYEFKWSESKNEVNNELDLILVRGFRTVFIECKSVTKLEQEYFHKLWSLSHRFGINTMNMMVANLYKNGSSAANTVQKDRANQMGIGLLQGQNEIKNIANTIIKAYKAYFGE